MALAGAPLAAGCGSSSTNGAAGATSSTSSPSPAVSAVVNNKAKLPPRLDAVLSSSGEVTVTNSSGKPVTHLASGHYTLTVSVESANGDFHLQGPLIGRKTRPHFTGVVLWGVHLIKGTYHYLNDYAGHPKVHTITVS
jgi:hypothetical protein